jgi:hypothetical protein
MLVYFIKDSLELELELARDFLAAVYLSRNISQELQLLVICVVKGKSKTYS